MLEVLIRMMEDGEYQKCLRLAEQQLLRGKWSSAEFARLNFVITRCRLGLQDPYGALNAGQLTIKLARDIGDWDTLGRTYLIVGTACTAVRQYDEALQHFYSYFEHLPRYTSTAGRLEGAIWKHIGVVHQRKLESDQAIDALNRARLWFTKRQIDLSAFSTTHDLVNTFLQMHDTNPDVPLTPVRDLLKEQRTFVRKYPMDPYYLATYLLDLAAYYVHQGRYTRARLCTNKAMSIRKSDAVLSFHCFMLLHRVSKEQGDIRQALDYTLAARSQASRSRHYELELLAGQAMADVIRHQNKEAVRELDAEFQAMGIDLAQYLSPALLGRPN